MLVQRQLTVLFSVLLVLGCSQDGRKLPPSEDGGQGGTGGVADSGASYASLEIVILGLPEHLPCPVLLNVSEEKEYLLYGSTDFPLIRPGTYQIRAPAFIPDHNTYYVTDFRGTNVHLEANQRERIEIRYERLPYLVHFEPLVVPWRGEAELRVRIEREPDFSGAFELSIEASDPAFSATPSTVSLPASESEAQFLIRNTGPLWSVETPFGLTLMVDDGDRAFGFRTNFGSIILVTSDADDGPGSLRDILEHADEVPHPRRVFFAENVRHIRLHSPLIFDSSRPLELRGHESFAGRGDFPPGVWLDAGDAGRALEVRGSLRIRDIGFQRGQARRGGCILNEGELIASGVWWLDCKAEVGGAIESTEDSILAIDRSTFLLNSAEDGGAIHLGIGAEARIATSTFEQNLAERGGAVLSHGSLEFEGLSFGRNAAELGGAVGSFGPLSDAKSVYWENRAKVGCGAAFLPTSEEVTIRGSHFVRNKALDGGALCTGNETTLVVETASFEENEARFGGALLLPGARLTLAGSSFSKNLGETGGGAIGATRGAHLHVTGSLFQGNEGEQGGALYVDGRAEVFRSAFVENQARQGGAIHGSELHLENSTVAHNRASETGGGLFLYDGLFDLRFTTLVMNEAPMGGGLYGTEAYLSLGGTIVARNTPHDLHLDHGENGELFSEGFNLLGIVLPEHRAMLSSSDLHGSSEWPLDPHLVEDLVSDHPSFSPRRGSPAVDAVPSFFCEKLLSESLIDQWGRRRPRGRACDAGSVEMY